MKRQSRTIFIYFAAAVVKLVKIHSNTHLAHTEYVLFTNVSRNGSVRDRE